jgi:hypothetical protein
MGAEFVLPTFTFRQAGVKEIELLAMPGPEARTVRAKIMRPGLFLGPGGQPKCGIQNEKKVTV